MRNTEKKGLRQRVNDSIFKESEFLAMAEDWGRKSWISPEDLQMVQQTLKKSEVKKLIETWLQILPFSLGITYFRETGSVGAGLATKSVLTGLGTYASTLLVQSIIMGSVAKRKLKGFPSSNVVPWLYFTPVIGDLAPLMYLSRSYPNFLRLLWAYRASKDVRNKKQAPPTGRLQEHLYEKIEEQKFQKGLKSIDRILRVTKQIWKRIDTVVNGSKKVLGSNKIPKQ